MKTRVVVTGMGAITPIGNDVESFWQALKDKTLGIGPITYFDTADFINPVFPACRSCACVPVPLCSAGQARKRLLLVSLLSEVEK